MPPKAQPLHSPEVGDSEDFDDLVLQKGDAIFAAYFPDTEAHSDIIQATSTPSQRLAKASRKDEGPKTFEELVPEEFRDYADVFSKDSFDKLPD